jgi:hypothetical protein
MSNNITYAGTTVDPHELDWGDNIHKRQADQVIFEAMAWRLLNCMPRGVPRRVLSLPGASWCWERALDAAYKEERFEFVGVERDARIAEEAKVALNDLPRGYNVPIQAEFRDYARDYARKSRRKRFDIIYLDWMGTWSKEKKADLNALLESDMLAPGGVLLLTLGLRRGRDESMEEIKQLAATGGIPLLYHDSRGRNYYFDNAKMLGIPIWVVNRAKSFSVDLHPKLGSVYYSRTGRGQTQPQAHMMFYRGP